MCFIIMVCRPLGAAERGPLRLPLSKCVQYDTTPQYVYHPVSGGISSEAGDREKGSRSRSINPRKAMYQSLFLPGWGQFSNGKKWKAALFCAAELVCIGGYIYENHQSKQGGLTEQERNSYRTDRNTFVMYFIISKILDITDAYVDAQLAGFDVKDITPKELQKPRSEK